MTRTAVGVIEISSSMILIWSGEGGPLQWLTVAFTLLQFFLPQVMRLTAEIRAGSSFDENATILSVPVIWVACALFTAVFVGGMWVIGEVLCWSASRDETQEGGEDEQTNANTEDRQQQRNNDNNNGSETAEDAAPSGTAANPVIIEDDEDNAWTRASARFNAMLETFSPTHLMLALGFVLPLAMIAPLLLNGVQHEGINGMLSESGGIVQVTVLAIIAHSMMAIAAYRVLREVVDGGGVGPYPGNIRGRRRRGKKLTVSEIADIVRKVPVEEFVSEEDVRTGECSVARMKRMLVNRGASEAAKMCVERYDLVKEVEKIRKFNEECAICAEEYVEGDVLRVPHCQHEFHLHCFDKWIYTFSTDSRPATHPTCPLCKATIK